MSAPRLPGRDGDQVDALVADRYLDALLAAGDRRALDAPADPALDEELRDTARVLRRLLVRVHPSFRFEERLASRLADLAAAHSRAGSAVAGGAAMIRFPAAPAAGSILDADPLLGAILAGDVDPTDATALDPAGATGSGRRPLLVGGAAITSAALSIVGVAIVAWRATRPATRTATASAMARAARTAHARQAAAPAALTGGPA